MELIAQEAEWVSDQVTTPKRLGSGEREDFLWLLQRGERGTISWRERKWTFLWVYPHGLVVSSGKTWLVITDLFLSWLEDF